MLGSIRRRQRLTSRNNTAFRRIAPRALAGNALPLTGCGACAYAVSSALSIDAQSSPECGAIGRESPRRRCESRQRQRRCQLADHSASHIGVCDGDGACSKVRTVAVGRVASPIPVAPSELPALNLSFRTARRRTYIELVRPPGRLGGRGRGLTSGRRVPERKLRRTRRSQCPARKSRGATTWYEGAAMDTWPFEHIV